MNSLTLGAPSAQTLFALDPGAKRTGVAVGNTLIRQAQPLGVVPSGEIFSALEKWIKEWQPQAFVVGLPTNTLGEATHGTALARKLGAQLQQRFQLPVYWVDERYSSTAAQSELSGKMRGQEIQRYKVRQAARHTRNAGLDALAATIILQQFFDESDA